MRIWMVLGLLGLLVAGPAAADDDFDYWVLALSWSPTYCAGEGDPDEPQCDARKNYSFVVHGLWPQYERGWPEFCGTPDWLDRDVIKRATRIMPSRRLVIHQWRKHGTCSGMSGPDYFRAVEEAFESVTVPPVFAKIDDPLKVAPKVIEDAFREANPEFGRDGVTVRCKKGRLQEVRLCLDKDFGPRICGRDTRKDCSARSILLPPVL